MKINPIPADQLLGMTNPPPITNNSGPRVAQPASEINTVKYLIVGGIIITALIIAYQISKPEKQTIN